MNHRAAARKILEQASRAEIALDRETWQDDMEIDTAIERMHGIDDLYRWGLLEAQKVSASFYEDCCAAYGFATETARQAYGLQAHEGADIEDLMQEIRPQRDVEDLEVIRGMGW